MLVIFVERKLFSVGAFPLPGIKKSIQLFLGFRNVLSALLIETQQQLLNHMFWEN